MGKKSIIPYILLISMLCSGCKTTTIQTTLYDATFVAKVLNGEEVAVGTLSGTGIKENKSAYFIPERIDKYLVVQMGYESGLIGRGNGTFSQSSDSVRVDTLYAPYTIRSIYDGYLMWAGENFKLMYCGDVVDLSIIDQKNDEVLFYVPRVRYQEFDEVFSGDKSYLRMANVVYDLNYDEHSFYYVDYVEMEDKIKNTPLSPVREGYQFDGWYKEKECIIKFDFASDSVSVNENGEMRLYAKWKSL